MNKNFVKIYLGITTVFCAAVFVFMPQSFTSIIFAGIFIINIFLFLDVLRRD